MADESTPSPGEHGAAHPEGEHGHDEIHLPPNSWVPISAALALTALFTGFLVPLSVGRIPVLAVVGGIWLIASLVVWYRGARSEYAELPD